jgi:hypothetical protein
VKTGFKESHKESSKSLQSNEDRHKLNKHSFVLPIVLLTRNNACKHDFCYMKTNRVSYVFFFTLNSNMLLELFYHPQFLCDRIFLKCNFSEFNYLSLYQNVLNKAEALYYIFNIMWA